MALKVYEEKMKSRELPLCHFTYIRVVKEQFHYILVKTREFFSEKLSPIKFLAFTIIFEMMYKNLVLFLNRLRFFWESEIVLLLGNCWQTRPRTSILIFKLNLIRSVIIFSQLRLILNVSDNFFPIRKMNYLGENILSKFFVDQPKWNVL